jgi:predicted GNAT family acetyltransferase
MARIRRVDSVDTFVAAAGAFLAAREAEHNLLLGICSGLQAGAAGNGSPGEPTPDFFVAFRGDRVVLAAVRTPPYNLVLSEVDDEAAIDALADELAGVHLPGVLGPAEHADAFAARWCAANRQTPRLAMSERIFRLTTVRPPALPPGVLRRALPVDRSCVLDWYEAFGREALPDAPWADAGSQVDRRLAEGGIFLWNSDRPVSMTVVGSQTPNGSRIGPVYTPPEHRRQGYASACVATVSQAQLDSGRRFVFLFTDLANPTSNRIYRQIGFEPVRDVGAWPFEEPPAR